MSLTISGRSARLWAAIAGTACCALIATAAPAAASVTEFPIPTANSAPAAITVGPDGNLWFTEEIGNKIGRITPTGTVTEFSIPTSSSHPYSITAGPDGNVWFAEFNGNQIGKITPTGTITEYPTTVPGVSPDGIAAGPDGNIWITVSSASQSGVLRMSTSGAVTGAFPAPHRGAAGITAGPDGNLWFAEIGDNYIARITTGAAPTIVDYLIPGAYVGPQWLTAGPDGNLWFTSQVGKIGKVTTAGGITVYPVPTLNHGGMPASGPDGNVWFTENDANQVARITPTGVVTEYPVPTAASGPEGIVTGPDRNLWFTESSGNSIGRFNLAALTATLSVSRAGSGSGSVSDGSAAIACPSACSHAYPIGTVVTLTAHHGSDSTFNGWSGVCSGVGTCTVTMSADRAVTATFGPLPRIVITKHKINRKHRRAIFKFKATGFVTGFQCALIKQPAQKHKKPPIAKFGSCKSPKTYKHLNHGSYTFEVRAVLNGATGPVTKRSFAI